MSTKGAVFLGLYPGKSADEAGVDAFLIQELVNDPVDVLTLESAGSCREAGRIVAASYTFGSGEEPGVDCDQLSQCARVARPDCKEQSAPFVAKERGEGLDLADRF